MAAKDLYNDVQSYLELTAYIKEDSVRGTRINVGEYFTVTFQVKNISFDEISPSYRYSDIVLHLKQPEEIHAELVDAESTLEFDLTGFGGGKLYGQEMATLDVEFRAVSSIGGFRDFFEKELVTQAFVQAKFDFESFFMVKKSLLFNTEIEAN